ncbi:MAG: molybdenum cofactor biosynthesis protein MoaE [Bowdeniella nasicola]|nr:molybdenum cofactor biosynthesis protein MoaE [Bowdeniella nasicola]
MPARVICAEVTSAPIDTAALEQATECAAAGAVVTFRGIVRNHDDARAVTALDYSAHPSATEVVKDVATDIADRFDVHALAVVHRVGALQIGDAALVAVVAASHRGEAWACIAALVDEIKDRLPVWKLQKFADGSEEWSNCP